MSRSFSVRIIGFAAAIIALTACSVARADTNSVTRAVSTHGMDLASPADQAKLRRQVWKAARSVCAQVTEGPDDNDFRYCVAQAFDNAWPQAEARIAAARNGVTVAIVSAK